MPTAPLAAQLAPLEKRVATIGVDGGSSGGGEGGGGQGGGEGHVTATSEGGTERPGGPRGSSARHPVG